MTELPIATYQDMVELKQAFDRVRYAEENNKLQIARAFAEAFYSKGKKNIGDRILKKASDAFMIKKSIDEMEMPL